MKWKSQYSELWENMSSIESKIFVALQTFAESVKRKLSALAHGEPEEQLRAPFENFMGDLAKALSRKIVCKGESLLKDRLGRPDYAIVAEGLLIGYVELKETGKGANPNKYKQHDKRQWERFKALPNLIYCDGNEWTLYRTGERAGSIVILNGDIVEQGKSAVTQENAREIKDLLTNFLTWEPIVPKKAKELAALLAPLCLMLRKEVEDALHEEESPLERMANEWRELLFPYADNKQFADAYAQTVTFALLLARSEGANVLKIEDAIKNLSAGHTLLSKALEILTINEIFEEVSTSLQIIQRVIDRVPETAMENSEPSDPWLYFYEDFLAEYDPQLRKNAGAYYTPVEVVHAQIRLVDNLLNEKLSKPLGFSDPDVLTLDPAVGTGTYLLGVIEHALEKIREREGEGAVASRATDLVKNLYGFEIMVGPYSVAELRVSRALLDKGADLPKDGVGVYLTDTLESPFSEPKQLGFYYDAIAKEHKRALAVKNKVPVIVCLGNPPYDRHDAAEIGNLESRTRTGGWVRWGDDGNPHAAILKEFIEPVLDAGHGGDLKNLYNLYVYFWRWALWKVYENPKAPEPGIVTYISAASFLDGNAFLGMREHMRRLCDEIWILDLGGEGRGTRRSENVFAIQTPVAITVAVCYKKPSPNKPAKVHYFEIIGNRSEKLSKLDSIHRFQDIQWQTCPTEWHAPFRPAGKGNYFDWPLLTDLMPWQHSGIKVGRTWPISFEGKILKVRWKTLCKAELELKKDLFVDRPTGRKVADKPKLLPPQTGQHISILEADKNEPVSIQRYYYRSFDRQYIIADNRVIDRPGPDLWRIHSNKQIYFATLLNHPLGYGPALMVCSNLPDLHFFRGSYGAKEIFPGFLDTDYSESNIFYDFFELVKSNLKTDLSEKDIFSYFYAILSSGCFSEVFHEELNTRELRIPITKSKKLFLEAMEIGRYLIWLHTYRERFQEYGFQEEDFRGRARCTKSVPINEGSYPEEFRYDDTKKRLYVGEGMFEPVEPEVFEFGVSGLKVVQSWLGYRMKGGKGKKSSPLDDIRPDRWTTQFTQELLELLWVLEKTLEMYPKQAELLDKILQGPLMHKDELPPVPDEARGPYVEAHEPLFDMEG